MASTTPPTRLRQIALVAEDLKRAEYLLTTVLGSEVVYVDPQVGQWGLENILVAIGGDIIEVVSPITPDTTAGRLLSKRGDGGYMIIMQTVDAAARKEYIEANGLGEIIFHHENEDAVCVQYRPKGIHGGIMPELDSHRSTSNNPDPVSTKYSPWHTCGPDYSSYSAGMKRNSHLQFISADCRISPTVSPTEAAQQWSSIFGIPSQGNELLYTNMKMSFTAGAEGEAGGLEWITIAVHGKEKFERILERASEEGLCGDGWINMLGVKWYFVLVESNDGEETSGSLLTSSCTIPTTTSYLSTTTLTPTPTPGISPPLETSIYTYAFFTIGCSPSNPECCPLPLTSLPPTLTSCPKDYSTLTTQLPSTPTDITLCCPTSYSLFTTLPNATLPSCYSSLSSSPIPSTNSTIILSLVLTPSFLLLIYHSPGLSKGGIAGTAIAGIVLFLGFIAFVIFLWRRRRQMVKREREEAKGKKKADGADIVAAGIELRNRRLRVIGEERGEQGEEEEGRGVLSEEGGSDRKGKGKEDSGKGKGKEVNQGEGAQNMSDGEAKIGLTDQRAVDLAQTSQPVANTQKIAEKSDKNEMAKI